jgi:dCTP deaminase
MILSDRDIRQLFQEEKILVKPKPDLEKQLGAASLDIHLGELFQIFNSYQKTAVDPLKSESFKNLTSPFRIDKEHPFILHPHQFVLAMTEEWLALPADIGARIEGRSSWGRLGVIVHSTAGYVDPGFEGNLTLEMSNISPVPILLYPGLKICQIAFETLSSPAEVPYSMKKSAKYNKATEPLASRIFKDFD